MAKKILRLRSVSTTSGFWKGLLTGIILALALSFFYFKLTPSVKTPPTNDCMSTCYDIYRPCLSKCLVSHGRCAEKCATDNRQCISLCPGNPITCSTSCISVSTSCHDTCVADLQNDLDTDKFSRCSAQCLTEKHTCINSCQ